MAAGTGVLAVFWLIAYWFPVEAVLEVANAMLFCVSASVSVAYAPSVYETLTSRDETLTGIAYLTLGIWIAWTTQTVWRGMSLIWLLGGTPGYMVHNDIVASLVVLTCCAGVLHLSAPYAIAGKVPPKRFLKIGRTIGLGLALGLFVVFWRPDLTWLAKALEPYIPR